MTAIPDRRAALAMLGGTALAACAPRTNRRNPILGPIGYPGPPIPLATDRIELTVRPRPAGVATPVDADFVVPPEQVARLWPRQRLRAVGGPNVVRFVIDEAGAVSRRTADGETVVSAIQARLIVLTPYGVEQAATGARVESTVRFGGALDMATRQEALHAMAADLAAKLDAQLVAGARQRLASYIRA